MYPNLSLRCLKARNKFKIQTSLFSTSLLYGHNFNFINGVIHHLKDGYGWVIVIQYWKHQKSDECMSDLCTTTYRKVRNTEWQHRTVIFSSEKYWKHFQSIYLLLSKHFSLRRSLRLNEENKLYTIYCQFKKYCDQMEFHCAYDYFQGNLLCIKCTFST